MASIMKKNSSKAPPVVRVIYIYIHISLPKTTHLYHLAIPHRDPHPKTLELGDYETHSRWDVVCWWFATMARTVGCFGWPEMVCITTGGVFSSGEVCSLPTLGQLAYKKVDANWTIWNLLRMWKQQHVFFPSCVRLFFCRLWNLNLTKFNQFLRLIESSEFLNAGMLHCLESCPKSYPLIIPRIIPRQSRI